MTFTGTTGTGLDRAIDLIVQDYGLNMRISGAQIREGAAAADGMNFLIVDAVMRLGLASDGVITTSDVYAINTFLRARSLDLFTALHGDDEGGSETGFHAVQNDGASTRLFGQAGIDTVLDGLYHIAFRIIDGHFVNEDGDWNASVSDVADWLNHFLAPELAAGTLANARVDPQAHGTTGTGLDRLTEIVLDDAGLNHRLSLAQINAGARASDGMAQIIVDAIRATGVADDGTLTELDMVDLNRWIVQNRAPQWLALHGDDENGIETGFHLVQGDGGRTYLYGERAVDTVADGLYHLGFAIQGDRLANEDGNANARLADVADWLSLLLADDLAGGTLASGHAPVDPATLAGDLVLRRVQAVLDDGQSGAVDLGAPAALALSGGTIALNFTANAPDDGRTHAIFSKDGSSHQAGDITAFINDGKLWVLFQDGMHDHWIGAEGVTIEAGRQYSLALTFGGEGLSIWLDGERVAVDLEVTTGLEANARRLVLGGSTWGRDAGNPQAIWDHFDGTVSGLTVYDRALDRFEIGALNASGPLPDGWGGSAALAGDQPAVLAGSGLTGEVFNRATSFASIDDLIAQTATGAPSHHFTASTVDFGGFDEVATLGEFFGDHAVLDSGNPDVAMTTIGMRLSGFIWLEAGSHLLSVRSDDGFLLRLGGDDLSSYAWGRGFSATSEAIVVPQSGLYAIELYYYENSYSEGLRLELDGESVGANRLFASLADYQAMLAQSGPMPAGGLPESYDGPLGTTGTGLDQLIRMIGEDQGLANNVSSAEIREAAAAADAINHMIVEAIDALGVLDDGLVTTAETYDISDYIRTRHYGAFVAAHGDDEMGEETGFHLIQNDGGTSYLFGDDAVNTVMDGLYHIGFATQGDRFANEDGNANARVETVAWWLNELLGNDPLPPAGDGPAGGLGSAANPLVTVRSGLNNRLAAGATGITLSGSASNATGNALANTLNGNDYANVLNGADGADTLRGQGGNDMLIGGAGADEMIGGDGDDLYWVDNASDVVREASGVAGGMDTVILADGLVARYELAGGIENLRMSGAGPIRVTGSNLANRIETGGGADTVDAGAGHDEVHTGQGADRLVGGTGDDWLDGGSGMDTMAGGLGDDSYEVDSSGDRVVELAGEGRDTVYAAIGYTLGATLENLVLTGSARMGVGNAGANEIHGNWLDNLIDGRGGADRMAGGYGADRYIVDNALDRVIEWAGDGIDTVEASVSFTLGQNVENLTLTGGNALSATGNGLANVLRGNDGGNRLYGSAGNDSLLGNGGDDRLTGGTGADRLTGGLGADRFIFTALNETSPLPAGRDTVTDFSRAEGDLIDLSAIDANGAASGNGAFHFSGAAFDGAAGALRATLSGGYWLVEGDVNGDGQADLALIVHAAAALGAQDFVL